MDSSCPLFPTPIQISDEEFHAFHSTDRKLFKVLIADLERDPHESINVMASWMWLEKKICPKINLIHTLVKLPYNLVNEVADETVICLICFNLEQMPFPNSVYELAVLPNLAQPNVVSKKLTLYDFHRNRACVIYNVNAMVKNVCLRAFIDLIPKKSSRGFLYPGHETCNVFSNKGRTVAARANIDGFPRPVFSFPVYIPSMGGIPLGHMGGPGRAVNPKQVFPGIPGAHAKKPQPHVAINNVLGRLSVIKEEDKDNVLPEDRTIFITFSRGYPIPEAEVRDFFTRKFGDFIEAIYMQDVPPYEQVLYARIVARPAAIVGAVVQGGRAKYNILREACLGKEICEEDQVV